MKLCSKCNKRPVRSKNAQYCKICQNEVQRIYYKKKKDYVKNIEKKLTDAMDLLNWIKNGVNEFWISDKGDAVTNIRKKLNKSKLLRDGV